MPDQAGLFYRVCWCCGDGYTTNKYTSNHGCPYCGSKQCDDPKRLKSIIEGLEEKVAKLEEEVEQQGYEMLNLHEMYEMDKDD